MKKQKELTITLDEQVYDGLYALVGQQNISQFIESLVRPHVVNIDLDAAYCEMAQDQEREADVKHNMNFAYPTRLIPAQDLDSLTALVSGGGDALADSEALD
ncbi:MAG: hypothetical protein JW850_07845 [Thermoflexales bacterium]|nr:hypothetical protein [Thermoflexales bacterium]